MKQQVIKANNSSTGKKNSIEKSTKNCTVRDYKSLTINDKLKVLDRLNSNVKPRIISKELNIDNSAIYRIKQSRIKLDALQQKRNELSQEVTVLSRKVKHPNLEEAVLKWHQQKISSGDNVSGMDIMKAAEVFAGNLKINNFQATLYWLRSFKSHYNLRKEQKIERKKKSSKKVNASSSHKKLASVNGFDEANHSSALDHSQDEFPLEGTEEEMLSYSAPQQDLEGYKLSHNNHFNLIFESLAEDESLMDVTLTAEGKAIKAHKSILSAVSPYFRSVLKENPCQHPIIIMPRDMQFQELNNIISYVYKGNITVATDDLGSLLKTAEVLEIRGLAQSDSGNATQGNANGTSDFPFCFFPHDISTPINSSRPSSPKKRMTSGSKLVLQEPSIKTELLETPIENLSQASTNISLDGMNPHEFVETEISSKKAPIDFDADPQTSHQQQTTDENENNEDQQYLQEEEEDDDYDNMTIIYDLEQHQEQLSLDDDNENDAVEQHQEQLSSNDDNENDAMEQHQEQLSSNDDNENDAIEQYQEQLSSNDVKPELPHGDEDVAEQQSQVMDIDSTVQGDMRDSLAFTPDSKSLIVTLPRQRLNRSSIAGPSKSPTKADPLNHSGIAGPTNSLTNGQHGDTSVPQANECPHCFKKFRSVNALKFHFKMKHPSKACFYCQCGTVFPKKFLLKAHAKHCEV